MCKPKAMPSLTAIHQTSNTSEGSYVTLLLKLNFLHEKVKHLLTLNDKLKELRRTLCEQNDKLEQLRLQLNQFEIKKFVASRKDEKML
ncbi:hypothetical protein M8J76_009319 [Diaphorina citri]|nr:hypothetical protein M8J75_004173 [Diaphorina citri]KAI5745222.1 hypothetical protein M8J76_009319 [Diaphorina citri]